MSNGTSKNEAQDNYHDPLGALPPDVVEAKVRAAYHDLWQDWFAGRGMGPAQVQVLAEPGQDDYSPEQDLLRFRLDEGDRLPAVVQDFDDGAGLPEVYSMPDLWARWRIALVHEISHEWQYKVLGDEADERGQGLFQAHGQRWGGEGHNAAFYSAIADFADHFRLDIEQLIRVL